LAGADDPTELEGVDFELFDGVADLPLATGRTGEGEPERLAVAAGQSATTSAIRRPSWSALSTMG
jgi:hypothetical protein